MTYYGWLEYLEGVKEMRQHSMRALGLWMGKLQLKVFISWDGYRRQRLQRREANEIAAEARATKLTTTHLHAWHGAWFDRWRAELSRAELSQGAPPNSAGRPCPAKRNRAEPS